ncbi:MAG: Tad domain-containing protein [Dehalococcoidia bacterium]|nr:Tad domain-containing protein [Dehalococcoidia bacterium]
MRMVNRLIRGEKGSVLALTTISMVVLLSFSAGVMDIGQMYQTRRQLQNATDGAALAGAQELAMGKSQAVAVNSALDYVQRNGVPSSLVDPGYPTVASVGPYTNNAVKVSATRRLNLLVAGLFNNGVGNVSAQATAVVGPMLPTDDLWPWGVPQGAIVHGQEIALKVGSPPPNPGNFGPLDFPPVGGGSNSYMEGIEFGYGANPGDTISPTLPWDVATETGNVVGKTRQGIDYLVAEASSSGQDDISSAWNNPVNTCTWPDAPKNPSDPSVPPPAGWVGDASLCYRVGIVPILESLDANGKGQVTIIGWAAFYLIGYNTGPGGLTNVWGYFLDKALVSGGRTNWGAPLTGLIGVRLWQ